MSIERSNFGRLPDGRAVELFTLRNRHGMTAKIINYGGIVTELHVPDRNGKPGNIVLGFDNLAQYLQPNNPYFGAIIGRVANRIAHGRFTIDGKTCQVTVNTPPNTLHGGKSGFDKKVWSARTTDDSLTLTYASPDGEEGFPGTLKATVAYSLAADQNLLHIDYTAKTDKSTPVNLTNHSYFNLQGPGGGAILDHVLMISADAYTPVDEGLIPTGQIAAVAGTPMDFRQPTRIGQRIDRVSGGYDHNYVLNNSAIGARVHEPTTGRALELATTQPGCQLYTGNFLDGTINGIGGKYQKHGAFCLETQHFPDSVNHPNFPSTILHPGQTYRQTAIYRFSTQ
jgi:aldose 1-epimerase